MASPISADDIIHKVTLNKVDYGNLESYIHQVYGVEYEIPYSEECNNDTSLEFNNVTGKLDHFDEAKLTKFVCGDSPSRILRILLEDLVRQNRFPSGDYLIRVSW